MTQCQYLQKTESHKPQGSICTTLNPKSSTTSLSRSIFKIVNRVKEIYNKLNYKIFIYKPLRPALLSSVLSTQVLQSTRLYLTQNPCRVISSGDIMETSVTLKIKSTISPLHPALGHNLSEPALKKLLMIQPKVSVQLQLLGQQCCSSTQLYIQTSPIQIELKKIRTCK